MAAGIGTAVAIHMILKALLRVVRNTSIETVIGAQENIDVVHWGYYPAIMCYAQQRDHPHEVRIFFLTTIQPVFIPNLA